jgi:hypothetical protein
MITLIYSGVGSRQKSYNLIPVSKKAHEKKKIFK